jgi:hypothetical protein
VTSVQARIQRMREWCEAITWDNREYRLSLSSVAGQVRRLDNIANTGTAIGDVYDPQFTSRFRGLVIKHWWQCTTETHVPNFVDTIEGPIKKSLFSSALKHNLLSVGFLGVVDFPTPQSPYVASHLELYREPEAEPNGRFYTGLTNALFPGYTSSPSKHTEVFHHSMMPSQIFLKTLAVLQCQLTSEGCDGDEWDIFQLQCEDQIQILYKRLCLFMALTTALHSIFSDIESIL